MLKRHDIHTFAIRGGGVRFMKYTDTSPSGGFDPLATEISFVVDLRFMPNLPRKKDTDVVQGRVTFLFTTFLPCIGRSFFRVRPFCLYLLYRNIRVVHLEQRSYYLS